MSNENVIEIINTDYIINIEETEYVLEVNNVFVSDYACTTNKPKINSVELIGNKTASALNLLTPDDIIAKENTSDKVSAISAESTHTQYVSAKCVYDNLLLKADTNLSNITNIAKNKINQSFTDLTGEVATDAEVLAQLKTRYKSTFDISKFTKIGSPTITDDGIVSGFSDSNYLTFSEPSATTSKRYVITIEYLSIPTSESIVASTRATHRFTCNGTNVYYRYSNSALLGISSLNIAVGDKVQFDVTITATNITFTATNITKGLTSTKTATVDTDLSLTGNCYLGRYSATGYSAGFCSVDIKDFLIVKDGIPALSGNKTGTDIIDSNITIPYTLSKTGSKIVDSAYRSRVQSMYSAYGFAPYYTLSDTDFTLPKGEIYGFITKAGIVEEYVSGTEGYRVWANGYCEQYGHLSSATTLTFTKEFKNTNYFMYPTSTKTATGCTFSSATTSDWIAKGYLKEWEY